MAWQAINDISRPWNVNGETVLQASTTITTSTNSTGVFVGRGLMAVKIDVTALELGDGFDSVCFYVEANSSAASTTWEQIGVIVAGDVTGIGVAQGVDTYQVIVNNVQDNQVRIGAYVLGSAASVTYSASVTPIRSKDIA